MKVCDRGKAATVKSLQGPPFASPLTCVTAPLKHHQRCIRLLLWHLLTCGVWLLLAGLCSSTSTLPSTLQFLKASVTHLSFIFKQLLFPPTTSQQRWETNHRCENGHHYVPVLQVWQLPQVTLHSHLIIKQVTRLKYSDISKKYIIFINFSASAPKNN